MDYLRNGGKAPTAAAFSARARPGMGVSMPVGPDLLATLTGGDHWTVLTAPGHLASRPADPWGGYWTARQSLAPGSRTPNLPST